MTEIHELICIACPVGCQIKAQVRQDKIISIEGNQCKRGEIYTQDEIFRPARVVTSTVRVQDAALPVVPVRTAEPVPKKSIGAILQELAQVTVIAPIEFHQTIAHDIAGTGVAVVASRPLPVREAKDKTA
jgi:CxxC motif-containing protein